MDIGKKKTRLTIPLAARKVRKAEADAKSFGMENAAQGVGLLRHGFSNVQEKRSPENKADCLEPVFCRGFLRRSKLGGDFLSTFSQSSGGFVKAKRPSDQT
ncbi:hypothetical protein H6A60_08195 [Sutterella massiliensis]|uniref:Uncharacterized protein n=1 Tax=Sutterella massiliensis TaxID=1816689 RepID=A0ABS2DSY0_9BURK|nr:hypothetical protein [Sutterella massiliensis]MBM6704459.1 hypothetical protein [Sutterella massiliensis]